MCCRWSQKILKITQSIGSSFFHCFVQLLHIVFLHWFVCQVRFMLKFSWCIHLFTLFLISDMISFSFMRFPVYIILLLIFFVSCYYVDSFKWANLFSFLSLSLSLSLCVVQQLKLVMDSIIWAFRHTERNIAETGLNLLLEMLKNFQVLFTYFIGNLLMFCSVGC